MERLKFVPHSGADRPTPAGVFTCVFTGETLRRTVRAKAEVASCKIVAFVVVCTG